MKENLLYNDSELIWQCKCFFVTITMAFNSPELTLSCVITLCIWLSSTFDQDPPYLDLVIFFVVVVVTLIVVGNRHLGEEGYVLIRQGALI